MSVVDDLPIKFDLFISYAHADDRDQDHLKVTALVEAIQADYLRVTQTNLRVFFDVDEIRTMDDWESRILTGLRQSKMMVAILSPAYFRSAYCKKEWELYVETELAHALPGNGITPIYVVGHPGYDLNPVEATLKHWISDLRRRQYIDWKEFWPHGASALTRADVRRKLDSLPGQIAERLQRAEARERSCNTVPLPSRQFVGRRDEMHGLLKGLLDCNIGAITAVNGIPGIGKSMLAFAYAWGYGYKYPGGRYLIPAANLTDLASGVIALAESKGVALTDLERQNPDVTLAKVKKAFEDGPPALLVIDNLDDPALLGPQSRARSLPQGSHIHVLVTTRISPDDLPKMNCLPLDALEPADALALLNGFRPIADSPQDDDWKAALEIVHRLGGHALAVEVVGVYLMDNAEVSYRQLAETLEQDGTAIIDEKVGPQVRPDQKWHRETLIARLLEPTLAKLTPEELRAVEYASILPPDAVPLPWLRELLVADFPDLAKARLGDKIQTLFRRLERLRLIVPVANDRGSTPPTQANPANPNLARMHRLVQDVVRRRVGSDRQVSLESLVGQFTSDRAKWMEANWGRPGLAWELSPLHDMANRMLDRGDRDVTILVDQISDPLQHIGRMQGARTLWVKAVERLRRLSEASPENADYARDLSISYNKLGDLAKAGGDGTAARHYYEDGLAIRRRLSEASPENADYARDLSISYERLGDLAKAGGDGTAARRYYEDGLAIRRRLSEASPENADYARDLSISYDRRGDLAKAGGDGTAARHYYEDGLAIGRRLSEASPENADYARDLSISYDRLGDLAMSVGDGTAARRYYEDGLAIRRRLSKASPENADYARDLWISYAKIAQLLDQSEDVEALAWWRQAWEILSGMKRRGMFISPGDEQFLTRMEDRFGFGG